MKIKSFCFNPFGVNTYILFDNTRECVIIDAACHENHEVSELTGFIETHRLLPKALLNTHGHVDHICGNNIMRERYGLPVLIHKDDAFLLEIAVQQGLLFGFYIQQPHLPTGFLDEGDIFNFGNSSLMIMHTPGHSPGSLVFYSDEDNFLISGDVLFAGSIGRTDLPGGNYGTLLRSIRSKILVLPEITKVYPGHSGSTTIGLEKKTNPFLQ